MLPSNNNFPYKIGGIPIEYIPIASTIYFLPCLFRDSLSRTTQNENLISRDITIIEKYDNFRVIFSLLPIIGNVVIILHDIYISCRKSLSSPIESKNNNEQQMLEAISIDGCKFYCASRRLKEDRKFSLKALKRNPECLIFVEEKFRHDKNFIIEAVQKSTKCYIKYLDYLSFADVGELVKDKNFLLAVLSKMPVFSEEMSPSEEEMVLHKIFRVIKRWGFLNDKLIIEVIKKFESQRKKEYIIKRILYRMDPKIRNRISGQLPIDFT